MEASNIPQGHTPSQDNIEGGQRWYPQAPMDDEVDSSHTLEGEPSQWIFPTLPTATKRYTLERTMEDEQASYSIEPLQIDYTRRGLHEDWTVFIHPEGIPFFCLPATNTRPMRVLTEAWLYDDDMIGYVRNFIDEVETFILAKGITIPPDSDLVLEPLYSPEEERYWCGYYFVHHPRRVLFWLEKFNLSDVSDSFHEVRGKIYPSHVASYLEVEYWAYWDNFPNTQRLTPEIYEYACDVITSSMTDVVSSDDSTIAEPYDKLRKMLDIVQAGRGRPPTPTQHAPSHIQRNAECRTSNWHIGRFMRHIVHNRFRNYYGQRTARLTRGQSVFTAPAEPSQPSILLKILSPLLFCVPDVQVTNMKALWVDGLAVRIHWNKLFEDLTSEWSQTTALATILLTANGAFLAIPLFDNKKDQPGTHQFDSHSSLAQVMSYLSLLTSLSSIILGLIMYRQHRRNQYCSVDEVLAYLRKHKNSANRLEHLALLLSLPYALLMWSMVTFLAAFLVMCFDGTLAVTKFCIGCAAVFNFALIVWCIVKFWDTRPGRWGSALVLVWRQFWGLFTKRSRKKQESGESIEGSQTMELSSGNSSLRYYKRSLRIVERLRQGRHVVRTQLQSLGGLEGNSGGGDLHVRRFACADMEQPESPV